MLDQEIETGLATTRRSCIRAIRSSGAVAITIMVLLQVCSIRAALVVVTTATVRSVLCWPVCSTLIHKVFLETCLSRAYVQGLCRE